MWSHNIITFYIFSTSHAHSYFDVNILYNLPMYLSRIRFGIYFPSLLWGLLALRVLMQAWIPDTPSVYRSRFQDTHCTWFSVRLDHDPSISWESNCGCSSLSDTHVYGVCYLDCAELSTSWATYRTWVRPMCLLRFQHDLLLDIDAIWIHTSLDGPGHIDRAHTLFWFGYSHNMIVEFWRPPMTMLSTNIDSTAMLLHIPSSHMSIFMDRINSWVTYIWECLYFVHMAGAVRQLCQHSFQEA